MGIVFSTKSPASFVLGPWLFRLLWFSRFPWDEVAPVSLGGALEGTEKLAEGLRASKRSPKGSGQGTNSMHHGGRPQHPKRFILESPIKSKSFPWPNGLRLDAASPCNSVHPFLLPPSCSEHTDFPAVLQRHLAHRSFRPGQLPVFLLGTLFSREWPVSLQALPQMTYSPEDQITLSKVASLPSSFTLHPFSPSPLDSTLWVFLC